MLGLWVVARIVSNLALPGKAIKLTNTALKMGSSFLDELDIESFHSDQRKGINRAEERFSEREHGTSEPIFPANVSLEDLPQGFEEAVKYKVTGNVLWKITEWNEFRLWVSILHNNSQGGTSIGVGRDGRWLVEIGRQRWEDPVERRRAFEMADKYRDIWLSVGMWREKSSM